MSDTNTAQSKGMGFTGWLTLVLIILKLNPGGHLDTPVADWSWWLVLLPMLLMFAISLVILTVMGVVVFFINRKEKREAEARRAAVYNKLRR